jgi:hypothetical protein
MHITKKNIHKFINGITMNCNNMGITHIDYIPESITHLYCYNNKLTSLLKLPYSLKYLKSYNNNLPYKITLKNLKEHNKLIKRKEILSKICV